MSDRAKAKKEKRRASAMEWVKEQQSRASGSTAVRTSGDLKFHKLEEGSNKFDVIPFLAGFGNKDADEGVPYWGRRYAIHKIAGIDGNINRHCCLYETWGKPCSVCRRRNGKDIDEELRKSLFAQVRHLMLINDKPGDTRNPVKLLDAAHFNRKLGFGEQLVTAMKKTFGPDAPHEGEDFDDPENGMTLEVECADAKYGSVSRIDFLKRKYKYPKDIAESMPCVDDFLQPVRPAHLKDKPLADFDDDDWKACDHELEKLLDGDVEGAPVSSNGQHEEPRRRRQDDDEDKAPAKKKSHSFQAGDQVEYEGEPHTIKKVRDDGTLVLEDEDGGRVVGIDADEVTALSTKGGKGTAAGGKSGKGKPKPPADDDDEDEPEDPSDLAEENEDDSDLDDDDDDDEEDDEEDEDDKPPAKAKGGRKK